MIVAASSRPLTPSLARAKHPEPRKARRHSRIQRLGQPCGSHRVAALPTAVQTRLPTPLLCLPRRQRVCLCRLPLLPIPPPRGQQTPIPSPRWVHPGAGGGRVDRLGETRRQEAHVCVHYLRGVRVVCLYNKNGRGVQGTLCIWSSSRLAASQDRFDRFDESSRSVGSTLQTAWPLKCLHVGRLSKRRRYIVWVRRPPGVLL